MRLKLLQGHIDERSDPLRLQLSCEARNQTVGLKANYFFCPTIDLDSLKRSKHKSDQREAEPYMAPASARLYILVSSKPGLCHSKNGIAVVTGICELVTV